MRTAKECRQIVEQLERHQGDVFIDIIGRGLVFAQFLESQGFRLARIVVKKSGLSLVDPQSVFEETEGSAPSRGRCRCYGRRSCGGRALPAHPKKQPEIPQPRATRKGRS